MNAKDLTPFILIETQHQINAGSFLAGATQPLEDCKINRRAFATD